jgi:hypothetical protein
MSRAAFPSHKRILGLSEKAPIDEGGGKVVSIRTDFLPQDHGFRFINRFEFSFDFELPLAGTIDLGRIVYGLCGGMSFAALDYFHTGRSVPDQAAVPDEGSTLYRYLWDRQLDSLSLPVGVIKVLEWMLRDDESVGRLVARREFPKVRRRLDRGNPAVLALIRVHGIDDPTQNHQVVARAYDFDEATRQLKIYVYDPNHPGHEPWLSMNLARPSRGIDAVQSSGEPLRGFFVLDYKVQTPP